jgi:hypothetical protein
MVDVDVEAEEEGQVELLEGRMVGNGKAEVEASEVCGKGVRG